MDEFSARIIAEMDEMKEHPERFQVVIICDGCGKRYTHGMPKDDVTKWVATHGNNIIHKGECEKCTPKEDDDD